MAAHSDIGASSAYRWMNCPGSVRLYGQLVKRTATEYASAGTAAHELCERCLVTGRDPASFAGEIIVADDREFTVDDSMVSSVSIYVELVRRDRAKFGGKLNVEKSFSLDWLYPGMFGRNDASLVPDLVFGDTIIYDYKNGRKAVHAERNVQCMYYALGALGKDNPMLSERVICKIVQPNCWGKDPVDEWAIPTTDLYAWAFDVLRPAAVRTKEPDAPCITGDWCCFCEAAGLCPARKAEALALLDKPAAPAQVASLPDVERMTPEQIGRAAAFFTSEAFQVWVKALAATEVSLLQRGVQVPGRKLVETVVRGNRRWASEDAVISALRDLCGDELFNNSLKSPAQVEKLLTALKIDKKEREALVSPLVTRDETIKTIVVSEDDERPSVADRKSKAIELFD